MANRDYSKDPNYSQGKRCSRCGTPVTNGAKHGICRPCMLSLPSKERVALGAKPAGRTRRTPQPAEMPMALAHPSTLPDTYLIACVAEAHGRAGRVEQEAALRAATIRAAIHHDPQATTGSGPVNGTGQQAHASA
jgi:ribosomal protein S14